MRRWLAAVLAIVLALAPGTALAHDGINRRINTFRENHDRRVLHVSDHLEYLARIRARQIVTVFTHDFWWLNHTACEAGGEVIAWRSPPTRRGTRARWFVRAWKNSPTHRAILLGRGWRRMGSAIYVTNNTMYGVALFCDPR